MKDKECIRCKKFFECPGKPKDVICLNFTERKKKDGDKQQTKRQDG